MRAAYFRCQKAVTTPKSFGLSRKCVASSHLIAFVFRGVWRGHCERWHFKVTFNKAFADVVQACADREKTWINDTIFALYCELHAEGHAQSVEVWHNDVLVGGAYGVTLGGAFFGESMFSTMTDASKVALAFLVDHLNRTGYVLLDTQFITDHLASLGAIEIPRETYQQQLAKALKVSANFRERCAIPTPYDVIQRNAQTS